MNENLRLVTQTYKAWIDQAARDLKAAGISSARLDAEIILGHTINKGRTYIHAHDDEILTERQQEIANARINLRETRVPLAYIIGHKEFYGRRFSVTTATLVPRPESEIMIDLLKEVIGLNLPLIVEKTRRLVDVGTGSGILGITAKLAHPELDVALVDSSRHALTVAEKNAKALGAQVTTYHGDLLSSYPFKADFILANLPYVDSGWERSPETNHEPEEALFATNGGKSIIFRLLSQVKRSLSPGGYLFIEADPEQHASIITEAKQYDIHLETSRDYQLVLRRSIEP